jgi:hypothetical protein
MPVADKDTALGRIFTLRDKVIAHQERLDEALLEQTRLIPSLAEMEKINTWVEYFCILVMSLLTPDVVILPHSVSARMAALSVIAKVLDKNFITGSKEYDDFYKRLPD